MFGMARPVAFDQAKARDKALLLFRQKGYQAASLVDLLEAGISRGKLPALVR